MRIGIFTDSFYPEVNGVATSCLNLYRALTQSGHEVHVYAPLCSLDGILHDPHIHYLKSQPFLFLKDRNMAVADQSVLREIAAMHFDLVHTNCEFVMGWIGRYAARKSGCPLVHTYHTIWEDYTTYVSHGHADQAVKAFVRWYSKWFCNQADSVITPTVKTRNLLLQYGVKRPIEIIPSGIDISRFAPSRHTAEDRAAVRSECGVQPGEQVLLYIGRLSQEKNVEQLMRVFPALQRKLGNVRFVIVGEGPLTDTLADMAEKNNMKDSVSLVGPRPWEQIDRYYTVGDVFASVSHSETQGLTYLEALASGLCVCAAADPCLTDLIEDGKNGILTGDSDEQVLEGLIRAFGPEGEVCRSHAESSAHSYSIEAFAENVGNLYRKTLAE